MSTLDYTNAVWADGRAVMTWLDREITSQVPHEALRWKVARWRNGAQASFWDLDEVLTALGLHVSQLPPYVWKTYDNGRRCTVRTRAGAKELAA
jgi:hypothetical protein